MTMMVRSNIIFRSWVLESPLHVTDIWKVWSISRELFGLWRVHRSFPLYVDHTRFCFCWNKICLAIFCWNYSNGSRLPCARLILCHLIYINFESEPKMTQTKQVFSVLSWSLRRKLYTTFWKPLTIKWLTSSIWRWPRLIKPSRWVKSTSTCKPKRDP